MSPPAPAVRGWRQTPQRVRKDLRISVIDGTAFSVMVGVGESYLGLFVLAAGLGQVLAGLVITLPNLLGAVLQLASLHGARLVGGLRAWTTLSAVVQALSWLVLAVLAMIGWVPAWAVFIAATLYYAGGLAAGASWTTLIGQLVPGRIRTRYFARRAWPCHVGTFLGLVAGGLLLEYGAGGGRGLDDAALADGLAWFAALFGIAFLARAVSAYYLSRHTDTGPITSEHVHVAPLDFIARLRHSREGRLVAAMILMTGAANIANPFFPVFLKDERDFSYAQIMILLATSLLTKAFAQVLWGELAQRAAASSGRGVWKILVLTSVLIATLPGLWMLHPSFEWLIVTQVVSGFAWAGWELVTLLMTLQLVREHERTSVWAQYNMLNAFVGFGGSLVGAVLMGAMARGTWLEDAGASVGTGLFFGAFLASIAGRLGVGLWLLRSRAWLSRAESQGGPERPMADAERMHQAMGDRT